MSKIELPPVTRESLPSILKKIGQTREELNTSNTVIPLVRRIRHQAQKLGEHTVVNQLYQEEFLSAQHLLMEEKNKSLKEIDKIKLLRGTLIMGVTACQMKLYEDLYPQEIDPVIKALNLRYYGRFADAFHLYAWSEKSYHHCLNFFDSQTEVTKKYHRLEIQGFLANSLLKQGKTNGNSYLTLRSIFDFDLTPEGHWLRINNPYMWDAWKTGIEIRTVDHLVKTNSSYKGNVDQWFKDADGIVNTNPQLAFRTKDLESLRPRVRNFLQQ